jgi:membrane fusion protein, copper/silver efflux system
MSEDINLPPNRDGSTTAPTTDALFIGPGVRDKIGFGVRLFFAWGRFVLILAVIGFVIVKWDMLAGYYQKWTRHAETDVASADSEYYCPMHPTVVRDNNKEKCPICFMPLSKRKKGEATDEVLPAGVVSRVQLTPYRITQANVHTSPVSYQPLSKEITTVGTVEFNERGLRQVAARVKGRIDKLSADETGKMVNKGDPLASLYSPDLVTTADLLLDADRAGNKSMVELTRNKLRLWGIDEDQIQEILRDRQSITHLTIRSPIGGHVLRKYVREGQYVDEGTPLYDLADLSTVWVQAQLYEEDLAFLPRGAHDAKTGLPTEKLAVSATVRGLPGETFEGNLAFIYPHVDQDTRTLSVRFELPNADHRLRPGTSATVRLRITPEQLVNMSGGQRLQLQDGKVLAVPESSVIDTGGQKLVYRQDLPGVFDGVSVELGPRMTTPESVFFYPVFRGVEAGEHVVTAGSFLIDAETRLNPAAGSIYFGGSGGGKGATTPGPAIRPSTPEDEDAKVKLALGKLDSADRALAEEQRTCPVLEGSRLGAMGVPVKLTLRGKNVFVCCKNCIGRAEADPEAVLTRAEQLREKAKERATASKSAKRDPEVKIREALAKLDPTERKIAEAQRICPITGNRLGSMGAPPKLDVKGTSVFICCDGCIDDAKADPDKTLKKVNDLKKAPVPRKK